MKNGCGPLLLIVLAGLAAPLAAYAAPTDEVNLALNKVARQSSVYPGGDAWRAVDGRTDGNFYNGSVAMTYADPHSWWEVDLGQVRQIGRIEISGRTDWCPTCLYPYMVIVSDYPIINSDITDPDANSWTYLMRVKVNATSQNKIPINRSGRYVRIALQNQSYLQLAEVKVIEQFNSAQARSATQSSSPYNGYDASKAVDGVTTGNTPGDVAITNYEAKPWWQVDMGSVQAIREVHIWSSNVSCCAASNPKKNLYVFTSPTPFTGDPLTVPQPNVNTYYTAQGWPAVVPINVNAQYVRVQLDGTDYLSLSEVQVFPIANGAIGGHPSMSSVGSGSWPVTFAIDKNLVTGEISTQAQTDNYIDVDLGAQRYVNTVRVWNSPDSSMLGGYYVFASTMPFVASSGVAATTLSATLQLPSAKSWIRTANDESASTTAIMTPARYLRIMQSNGRAITGVREIEVITPQSYQNGVPSGWVNSANPVAATIVPMGYTTRPGALVYFYTYAPNVGSGGTGGLVYLTSAASSTTPTMTSQATVPVYSFFAPYATVNTYTWAQGGMVGLWAYTYEDDLNNYTPLRAFEFDNQESPFWPDVRLASSTPTPDDNTLKPKYLDSPMGTWRDPAYNPGWPSTLSGFMAKFFPPGGNWPVAARFYNKNELGIGREVRCVHNPTAWYTSGAPSGSGTICISTQYGPSAAGNPVYGNQSTSLSQLQQQSATPIDTVAMLMNDGSNRPIFGAYDDTGHFTQSSQEDNTGSGRSSWAPNSCMSCHGGSGAGLSANTADHWFVKTGTLLPIDAGQLVFAGSPYTYAQQQESIRMLNAMIMNASPKPGVADFINGTYPNGVGVSGSQPKLNYVPSSWNLTDGRRKVYNDFIKPYCRMCHLSQEASAGGFELTNADDAEALRALIVSDVCITKRMPHAQQTMKQLWASPGRATMLGFFARHDMDGERCAP